MLAQRRAHRGVLLALFAVVATACGSTVPAQEQAGELGIRAGDGVFGGGSASGDDVGSGSAAALTGGDPNQGTSDPNDAAAGSSGQQSTGSHGGVSAVSSGLSPITLGLAVAQDTDVALQAVGVSGAVTGIDGRRAWTAVVNDTNKRGGIAGRKVVPVFHELNSTSTDFAQDLREACVDWTQDHHVYAALATGEMYGEDFYACMEKGGAAVVSGATTVMPFDQRVFPRYPHYVAPFALNVNTQASALVNGLAAMRDYFTKGAKLGLVTFDQPYFDYATKQSLLPALRRHGLELTDSASLRFPEGYDDYGQVATEAANAALSFKAQGITHVMILDIGSAASLTFMQAAERQQYRPRYGLTSQGNPTTMADILGEDADNQLHGARAIGWAPPGDVRAADDRHSKESVTFGRCLDLMRRNDVAMTSRTAEWIAVIMCEQMRITKAIVEGAGGSLTRGSFIAGIDRLGSSFVPALTFATRLNRQIRDGVAAVAPLAYFEECRCYRYTGRPYAIST